MIGNPPSRGGGSKVTSTAVELSTVPFTEDGADGTGRYYNLNSLRKKEIQGKT